jgi:hypothetical protein
VPKLTPKFGGLVSQLADKLWLMNDRGEPLKPLSLVQELVFILRLQSVSQRASH